MLYVVDKVLVPSTVIAPLASIYSVDVRMDQYQLLHLLLYPY